MQTIYAISVPPRDAHSCSAVAQFHVDATLNRLLPQALLKPSSVLLLQLPNMALPPRQHEATRVPSDRTNAAVL